MARRSALRAHTVCLSVQPRAGPRTRLGCPHLPLQLTLERPAGSFLAALSYPTSWAAPKHLIDQYADQWTEHLADNGGFGGNLYRLTRWDHAGHLELERNERFWGKKPLLRR